MIAEFVRCRIAWPAWWSFPQSGNGLSQPLDSSLRWNDGKGGFRLSPKPARFVLSCFPLLGQYNP